jgi:hypothetical protein
VFPTIGLRLYTRVAYTGRLWADDYATILATVGILVPQRVREDFDADNPDQVLLASLAVIDLCSAHLGLGMHYWTIPTGHGILILKVSLAFRASATPLTKQLFYAESIIYTLLLITSKVSILLLYARLFPVQKFLWAIKGLGALLGCHGVLFVLLIAMQCLPVYAIWDRYVTDRKCIDVTAVAYTSGALSILADIAILLLPIPQVWKLKIDRRRQLELIAIFSIGSLYVFSELLPGGLDLSCRSACFTSMNRMKFVVQYNATFDATWDNVDIIAWSAIEQFTAMFCGSLPALRLLFVNVRRRSSAEVSRGIDKAPSHVLPPRSIPDQHLQRQTWSNEDAETRLNGIEEVEEGIRVTRVVDVSWLDMEAPESPSVYPDGKGSHHKHHENR